MADYKNDDAKYPELASIISTVKIPGVSLPEDFALEAADRIIDSSLPDGEKPTTLPAPKEETSRFPTRNRGIHGEAIARLIGAFSGPGFNITFRPHSDKKNGNGTDDDLLELNLTHELWKFPATNVHLGKIPNRVAKGGPPNDVDLRGIPYTQIVRDVTIALTGKEGRISVDRLGVATEKALRDKVNDIHFETGLFIHVPNSQPVTSDATISRMASIPHGTSINAQGAAAIRRPENIATMTGTKPPEISFSPTASKPFHLQSQQIQAFEGAGKNGQFNLTNDSASRLPAPLGPFLKEKAERTAVESITEQMIQDPNWLLQQHNKDKKFSQVIQFTVSTIPSKGLETQACPHLALNNAGSAFTKLNEAINKVTDTSLKKQLQDARDAISSSVRAMVNEHTAGFPSPDRPDLFPKGITVQKATELRNLATGPAAAIGSANIAMLDGTAGQPNARTSKVEATFWISTVFYTVTVPQNFDASKGIILSPDEKDTFVKDTVPDFLFPLDKPVKPGKYQVEATQIQYSQTVNLIFNTLVWPHISVATVVPIRPVLIRSAKFLRTN